MRTPEELAAIYRRAAEVVRNRGLARGILQERDGRVCAIGALCLATDRNFVDDQVEIMIPVARQVGWPDWGGALASSPFTAIGHWNDHQANGPEDVAQMFERAAEEVLV